MRPRWVERQTSINTNKRTVLGPKRINAGVHPLNKNLGPSFLRDALRISDTPSPPDCGEMLSNSSGEQEQFERLRGPLLATLLHQQERTRLEGSISNDVVGQG